MNGRSGVLSSSMSAAEKIAPTIKATPFTGFGYEFASLYTALAEIFKHTWMLRISHAVDGLPAFIVEVHPPSEDQFMYDERVFAAIKKNMPSGYYDDGTCGMCGDRGDGSTEREYHIYPEKR